MRAIFELLRISLFPTAAADAAVGVYLGQGAWPADARPYLAMAASLAVYHGAMALNDWFDREHDRQTRPGRVIPSGRIRASTALLLGMVLWLAGPLVALSLNPLSFGVLSAVALCAFAYDWLGRGPILGPLLLGLCRAGNLCFGMCVGAGSWPATPWLWLALAGYGWYVFAISRIGRLEDGPKEYVGSAPSWWLMAASVALLAPALAARSLPALLLSAVGAWSLLSQAWPLRDWQRAALIPTMGKALRLLLVYIASLALTQDPSSAYWVAAVVLLGYVIAQRLRQSFPPS